MHVGQEDRTAREARRLLGPDKIVGVSAHTVEEAVKAERDGADYLGVGAVFHTDTKTDVSAMPLDTLRAIRAAVRIPIVAIGGISLANVERLAAAASTESRSSRPFLRRRTSEKPPSACAPPQSAWLQCRRGANKGRLSLAG